MKYEMGKFGLIQWKPLSWIYGLIKPEDAEMRAPVLKRLKEVLGMIPKGLQSAVRKILKAKKPL